MERIQLRFVIKENSPLENVLKPKTGFNIESIFERAIFEQAYA